MCTSAERFYVAREVYDDFVSAFVDYTSARYVGDPLEETTDVGPMVSAGQREKVEAQVEAAVAAGAELLMGGDRAGQERGHYFAPAVVTGAARETELLSEETFGPVAPIVPVSSLDEAISLPTQLASASARTSTRATSRLRSAACVRSEPAPCGSTIR